MSTISACSEGGAYLFRNGMNDINGPVVVYDRPVAGEEGGIAVLIDDACL